MQDNINLSKHSKTRMKERSGITNNSSEKMAKRAMLHGVKPEETTGLLRQWIGNRRLSRPITLYIYAGMAYIFNKNTLITAICVPEEIKNHLSEYVNEDAWNRYEKHRKSLQRHKGTDKPTIPNYVFMDRKTVKALVNRYFSENDIPFYATNVSHSYANNYTVHYVSNIQSLDKLYLRQIRKWGENERNIKLTLKHNKNPDGSYALLDA